jgi:hypothetical protein
VLAHPPPTVLTAAEHLLLPTTTVRVLSFSESRACARGVGLSKLCLERDTRQNLATRLAPHTRTRTHAHTHAHTCAQQSHTVCKPCLTNIRHCHNTPQQPAECRLGGLRRRKSAAVRHVVTFDTTTENRAVQDLSALLYVPENAVVCLGLLRVSQKESLLSRIASRKIRCRQTIPSPRTSSKSTEAPLTVLRATGGRARAATLHRECAYRAERVYRVGV